MWLSKKRLSRKRCGATIVHQNNTMSSPVSNSMTTKVTYHCSCCFSLDLVYPLLCPSNISLLTRDIPIWVYNALFAIHC